MRLSSHRWLGPIPAALVLQAIYGLLFANGVFVSVLNNVTLTKAVGLAAFFTSLGITAFGILLHNATDTKGFHNFPRFVAILGSIGVAAQTLVAHGLYRQSPALVYFASALVGTGSGSVYVVSLITLQEWVPESPGFAAGLGLLIGGGGSLFGIYAFQVSTVMLGGALPAMALAGFLSGTVSLCAAIVIERPPTGWSPLADILEQDDHSESNHSIRGAKDDIVGVTLEDPSSIVSVSFDSGETELLLPHKTNHLPSSSRLSIVDILTDPAFILVFIAVGAAVGPGFGFVIAFPQMVNVFFNVDMIHANQLLFWMTSVGVVARIGIGIAIDFLSANTSDYGFSGAKHTNTILLALQCAALALMPICIRHGWTMSFTIAAAVVNVTFSGGAVVSACLARSVFSPEHSTLAFALLGIAVGIGRGMFSCAIAPSELSGTSAKIISVDRISEYDPFLRLALVVTIVGLVASYCVNPSKTSCKSEAGGRMFANIRV